MIRKLLDNFINDVKVEAIKFRLQTSMPHAEIQYNKIIGNFDYKSLDSDVVGKILREELDKLKELQSLYSIRQLKKLVDFWNTTRLTIQYSGYGYDSEAMCKRGEAYTYVLLLRILKRNHKELYKVVKKV